MNLTPPQRAALRRVLDTVVDPDARIAARCTLLVDEHGDAARDVALCVVAEHAGQLLEHTWQLPGDVDDIDILEQGRMWRVDLDALAEWLAVADRLDQRAAHPATPVAV